MHKKDLIINPCFITGLIILLLNDFYFKQYHANFLTGKLSDFSGLLIFPMFVATVFPKSKPWISFAAGLGFIFWKSPFSGPFIDAVNILPFITTGRVIDYSDYLALPVLLVSHYQINRSPAIHACFAWLRPITHTALLITSLIAFCATTMIRAGEMPQGTIYIGKIYTIKMPKDSCFIPLKRRGTIVTFILQIQLQMPGSMINAL